MRTRPPFNPGAMGLAGPSPVRHTGGKGTTCGELAGDSSCTVPHCHLVLSHTFLLHLLMVMVQVMPAVMLSCWQTSPVAMVRSTLPLDY